MGAFGLACILIACLTLGCISEDIEDIRAILDPGTPGGGSSALRIGGMGISPHQPDAGQAVTISALIENGGKGDSGTATLCLFIGDEEVSRATIPNLESGETANLTFEDRLALPAGVNPIMLVIDPSGDTVQGKHALGATVVVGKPSTSRSFNWTFNGYTWKLCLSQPLTDLQGLEQDRALYSYQDYLKYLSPNHPTVESLAHLLGFYGELAGLDPHQQANFILSFVQEMPYSADQEAEGNDYPKYPVETLHDGGGDCEDTSLLFASLMSNEEHLGYGAALIIVDEHMGVGIAGEKGIGGVYFSPQEDSERRYYYCETTGRGYTMGELPEEYDGASFKLLECP